MDLRRFISKISIRLLAFNVLLVFLPAAAVSYLEIYESQLLRAQEQSMVQQGRVLAAALSERGPLSGPAVEPSSYASNSARPRESGSSMLTRFSFRIRVASDLSVSPMGPMRAPRSGRDRAGFTGSAPISFAFSRLW